MNKQTKVQIRIALMAMGLGVFMGLLDVTVVNVALPTMDRGFNTTFTDLQWVLNAYTLVYAVTLMIMSKLGDMYGRKKIFLGSLILFVIASAINGMAPSLIILDIGRGVQAIGGAAMMSLSMALVASNFEGKEMWLSAWNLRHQSWGFIRIRSTDWRLFGRTLWLASHFLCQRAIWHFGRYFDFDLREGNS
ncbi:hypothetical protein HMPREF9104_02392 [Lentilactobacillus kisonensis F0435]|uniref:Major facilitator superfamily (MFS) profile domain-containing protein n=1 Tax=Lentilactobacillus kisonensis F0435 TaxID=797516 RepID=H1LIF1_9LACO|nr:hypothetical protein HMPREF9104_02392 [Lentilactobacillus kisonensis F0435]